MKKYIVIVAGGQGTRMSGTLPKQFITLAGKPILQHTLELFDDNYYDIVLVMNPEFVDFWKDLVQQQSIAVKHKIIAGGSTRAESVKNGVMSLEKNSLVAVHDAVRPFVTSDLLEKLFVSASNTGSACPIIELKDTLREITAKSSMTVPRSNYRAVQTPQVFQTEKLQTAFSLPNFEEYTDEASLYQAAGNSVTLVKGEEQNIKITVPNDLLFAEAYLKAKTV